LLYGVSLLSVTNATCELYNFELEPEVRDRLGGLSSDRARRQ